MKIAILSFYSGIHRRGVERWVIELSERLSKKHDITVYQSSSTKNTSKYKTISLEISYKSGKKEILFPLQKRAFLDYKSRKVAGFAFQLLPKLWKGDFDIVIPTDGGWEPALIRILTWIKRSKVVVVGHAGIGWDDRNNLWSFADCFVALSTYAKKWAKKVNPFVRVEYIPDGVDLDKFKPGGKKLVTNLKRPVVLCVSALTKTKRVDLIIKAVSKLKNVSLLVVGGGELKGELTELGKKLLGDRFKMSKYHFDKMPEVYRAADIFVNASLPHHSFEMVILEAMATNLPVVVNNDLIRKEIVGDAGILINPIDTDEFAGAIEKALKIKWGNKPRSQAEKFFWDKIVNRYEILFEELCK